MRKFIKKISRGLSEILYPGVCMCCGLENTASQRQICSFCLSGRFEDANPDNKPASSDTLLPNEVLFQHALWVFDKGGDLQNLLHYLKYERLTAIGRDLGRTLALRIKRHEGINNLLSNHEVIILPVPLHYLKYRYRGFNQAFEIACGFQEVYPDIPISTIKDVLRVKNTSTQTGFSLEQRLRNIDQAFVIKNPASLSNRICIIIDDVFTTGATTFELARQVKKAGAYGSCILTAAQA